METEAEEPMLLNPLINTPLQWGDQTRAKVRSRFSQRFHARTEPLINTGALARWKDALQPVELFQQFAYSYGKPLKRLTSRIISLLRAKAPVLMRTCWNACEISGFSGFPILNSQPSLLTKLCLNQFD